jgi:hypothetical protein
MRGGTHREAMQKFFGSDLAAGGMVSVWIPERVGAMWVRCPACSRMVDSAKADGKSECGAVLPEAMGYW